MPGLAHAVWPQAVTAIFEADRIATAETEQGEADDLHRTSWADRPDLEKP
jgi:hypothetical protein